MRSPIKTCSVMLVLLALALAGCQSAEQAPTPTALPPGEQPVVVKTAEASPITVTSERRITDIINEKSAAFAAVSPDGSRLAWARAPPSPSRPTPPSSSRQLDGYRSRVYSQSVVQSGTFRRYIE